MPATRLISHLRDRDGAVFESTDPEKTVAFVAAALGIATKISGDYADYRFRLARLCSGTFEIITIDHTGITDFHVDPLPAHLVAVRIHGGTRINIGLDDRLGPGELSLNTQPGQPVHVRLSNAQYKVVIVPIQAAADVARNRPDEDLGPLGFDSLRPVDPAAARRWLQTVDYVADSVRADPAAMTQPLLAGAATRLLAATLLATFPNTWVAGPHHQDRSDATHTTLTRAIAFIDTNADLDISAVDIARAACVSVRAVQLAFRRHLDTTPRAYLRRVRLERAHEQLRAATPHSSTTIGQVAARWGFSDPSRFTALYRTAYGQLPSHTLRS